MTNQEGIQSQATWDLGVIIVVGLIRKVKVAIAMARIQLSKVKPIFSTSNTHRYLAE